MVDGRRIFSILTFQVSFPGSVSRSDKYLPLKLNSNTLNATERDGHEEEEVPQESPPQEEHVNDKKSLWRAHQLIIHPYTLHISRSANLEAEPLERHLRYPACGSKVVIYSDSLDKILSETSQREIETYAEEEEEVALEMEMFFSKYQTNRDREVVTP